MVKKTLGFTLVELLAVIVILAIILAIAVPNIANVTKSASSGAFESDAKLLLKTIDYRKLADATFDATLVNETNVNNLLGLSNNNYESIRVINENGMLILTIIGKDKWEGFIACGTYNNMKVVESTDRCSTDLIPPTITLLGTNPSNIYINQTYNDAGATAVDDKDGDITGNIVVTGTVNPNLPGSYVITYTVTDTGGNTTTIERVINVIDNVGPSIAFIPNGNTAYVQSSSVTVNVTDPGSIAPESLRYVWSETTNEPLRDTFTNSFASGDVISSPSGVSGDFYLWILASDVSNNETVTRSNIFKLDNQAPLITLNGSVNMNVNRGSVYTDPGATATDNIDTFLEVISSGMVNTSIVGTYTITYDVSDDAGNSATPVIRTVNVIDVEAPVITILGSNPVNINVGSTYSDAGATAIDDVDGDVSNRITTTSNVNINVAGTYNVTYTVRDNANNVSSATRVVNVIDNIAPTVAFGTNGNATYATSRSTTVSVSDAHTGVNTASLKYLWNTSTTTPTQASFTTSFANGGTITSPSNVSGGYYLWILAIDNSGNTAIVRTNVFNLDNTSPTYSSYAISNVTSSGYDIYLYGVADAHSGMNRIQFPTWTSANGQDDLVANWQTNSIVSGTNQGGGTWYFRVNITDHNNESGAYITHVYMYDNVGKLTYIDLGTTTVSSPYLVDLVNAGDFISYTGNNGCTNCSGQSVTCYQTYANTYSGWRVLSKSGSGSSGTITIVAAGTTECVSNNSTVNTLSQKYMNTTYATSARSINCADARVYTPEACTNYTTYASNSLIVPGGFYYFSDSGGWAIVESGRFNTNSGYVFGIRPVITLKAGLKKAGGSGTSSVPYTMSF